MGAEETCKRSYGSHLASVIDQQTDDFIARKVKKGEAIWIGAKQTFESSWAWADGCSLWNHTSWDPNALLVKVVNQVLKYGKSGQK